MGKRTLHCLLTCQFPSSSSVIAYPASSTCQDIMRPRLQLMRAAHSIERLLSGLQSPSQHTMSVRGVQRWVSMFSSSLRLREFRVQMICVIQTKPTSRLLKLLRRETLQRSLRRHGHENGQRHGAMWEVQRCCSRAGCL